MRAARPGEAGVTLVEMIVVLVIIAIVAGMIVGSGILNRPDQARVTTANADLHTISAALKLYRLDNGDYPTTAQGLKALAERPETPPLAPNWNPEGYLPEVPVDPWGHPYVYQSPAPGGFALTSLGKDGKPGGEGLDADIVGRK
ncbi:type II secretion system major pseudopilin GspG [Sphingomonas sp.]|uniref:type II secretion system major pseudopilin GspG n=1 Tax=Sphingomonas sp. TaxID=28214 RepID=UPI002CE86786|nr:type II secretion system major pseudopilin GspG [Sphingomonas sp.]HWK35533.1 type II secretion system major pseudopilin GspG [Sphingomonas sp.]